MAWLATKFLASASLLTFSTAMASESAKADDNGFLHTHYDGVTNNLLTAGLGKSGLGGVPGSPRVRGSAPSDCPRSCGSCNIQQLPGARRSFGGDALRILYGTN